MTHPTITYFWNNHTNFIENKNLTLNFSDFYLTPKIVGKDKLNKNLIYIYVESLERTYFDNEIFPGLLQELTRVKSFALDFTNIHQHPGTEWTISGMVASQCGLPLVSSSGRNAMSGMSDFYAGAVCLGDLLHNEGYFLSMMQGSSTKFSGIRKFYNTHKFDEVLGGNELTYLVHNKDDINPWGLNDDVLLEGAYQKISKLSKQKKKFALYVATIGTHHPNGHLSASCHNLQYHDGANPILNAVSCTDKILSNFIRKVATSTFFNDTILVIASDHLAMNNSASSLLNKGNRKNLFLIFNFNNKKGLISKPGSTLDIGPTVLHTLGFNSQLSLGRNLFTAQSLTEQLMGVNDYLRKWFIKIREFWQVSRLKSNIIFR